MSIYKRLRNKIVKRIPSLKRREYAKKQEPETKVLVAGFMLCKNLGDAVISDCTSHLILKAASEFGLKKVRISEHDIKRQKDKASLNRVRNSDLVVFPGGGFIKYKQESFPIDMERILSRAEHYGIPVMYNAMGVEGYECENEGCQKLERMLRSPQSRYITSRDFADFLNETYLKDADIKARRVADPAVFTDEVYGIKKDKTSDTVGLGVCRHKLFEDYGLPVSGDELLEIWKNIIEKLNAKGIKWKLFTNGLKQDEDFLTDLLEYLGLSAQREKYSLPAPETARELVKNISKFKSVIACRMHANIIAFSMDIPTVAFVWNEKLRFFGKSIDCSERYLEHDKIFDAEFVVDTLIKAENEGYKDGIREREKKSAYESVKDYFAPFAEKLLSCRRRDLTKIPLVCYGLPNLESEKLNREFFETQVDYFVSDDDSLVGTACLGKKVYPAKKLKKFRKPFVIVSETVDYIEAAKTLKEYKYIEKYHFTNMHSYKRYVFKKGEVFI